MRALLPSFLALAVACQRTPGAASTEIRRTIESSNAKIIHWYANGQADSLGGSFAQDAWQFPPNMAPLVGRDSIIAFWRNALRAGRWSFELKVQDVLASGTLATERGSYTVGFVAGPSAPFPSFQDQGNYVVVWRKDADGVWRILWDAPVSSLPLPQPPPR